MDTVFISHAGRDRAWAEWVAWQLSEAGLVVELDAWDWHAHDNIVLRMNDALHRAGQLVALYSGPYFERWRFTTEEWTAALAARQPIVALRIEEVEPPAILRPLRWTDLFGLSEEDARRAVLGAVRPGRPTHPPRFPDPTDHRTAARPSPRLPGTLPPVWNLRNRSPQFTGRDALLLQLRHWLPTGSETHVVALHGLGGVGKTEIALEYAHRFAGNYERVWWVNAEQPALISEQLAAFAVAAGLAEPGLDVQPAVEALRVGLRRSGRWLLILDNVPVAHDITDWLIVGSGHVIITSLSHAWGDVAHGLLVTTFRRTESTALLAVQLGQLEGADRLAERLRDLPLALAQAVGVMAENATTVDEYIDALNVAADTVLGIEPPSGYHVSLAAAVRVSVAVLGEEDVSAAKLVRLCALFGPEPIPLSLFTGAPPGVLPPPLDAVAANTFLLRQCLGLIGRYGLLQIAADSVTMHRLTQDTIRAIIDTKDLKDDRVTVESLLVGAGLDDGTNPDTWARWRELLPHILATGPASTSSVVMRRLACQAVSHLCARGDLRTALPFAEQLWTSWTARPGPDDFFTQLAAQLVASILSDLGEYGRARVIDEALLAAAVRRHGRAHPTTADAATNLRLDLLALGDTPGARELAERYGLDPG